MPFASPSDPPAELAPDTPTERDTPADRADAVTDSAAPLVGRSRLSFHDSRLRPILSCAGALGLGLTLAPLVLRPAAPVATGKGPLAEVVLARESTLVVTPTLPPGALLRGRLRLVAGATDAVGRAPVGGQVARQLVENGARVQRGDAIVEITSGAGRRAAPASESRQNSAEQSQIAAADAQTALSQKIATAQIRLRAAQERVTRAQAQTGAARDIVRRLQNGQSVSPEEIPAPFAAPAPEIRPQTRSRRSRRNRTGSRAESRPNRAVQIAARQAQAAREAAQESAQALTSARAMLFEAQNVAHQADEKAGRSAQAVVDVEAQFDAKKASGADVEAARIAQKDAQSAVNAADKALIFAKTELGKREKNAAAAQSYAQTSAAQAAKILASARLEPGQGAGANDRTGAQTAPDSGENAPEEAASGGGAASNPAGENAPPSNATPGAPGRVTLDNAIRFASEALDESRRASREAERINSEIAGYQSQVTRSNSRIEAATQNLESAQQSVMSSVPRVRFTSALAPASGIVTWISRLAREVGAGDAVFGIAGSQRVAARFEDKSGLWRAIKPGAILTAFVVDAPAPSAGSENGAAPTATSSPAASLSPATSSAPLSAGGDVTQLGAGHAVSLKMTEVGAPPSPDKPATLAGAIVPGAGGAPVAQALTEGAQILVSVPRPQAKATLSVPASALLRRGAATYIAVLAPLTKAENEAQNQQQKSTVAPGVAAPQNPNRAGEPGAASVATGTAQPGAKPSETEQNNANEAFHLRWVRVETGRSDGLRLEIVAGLRAGERVVSAPDDLEAMGFAPAADAVADTATDAAPTVFDTQNATTAPNRASQAPDAKSGDRPDNGADAEVLVRLTGAAA